MLLVLAIMLFISVLTEKANSNTDTIATHEIAKNTLKD